MVFLRCFHPQTPKKGREMARDNYAFAKRQRDLAKQQKKEAKRLRKAGMKDAAQQEVSAPPEGPPAGDEKPVV